MPRSDRWRAALDRHIAAEREAFALPVWATCPVSAGGDPPAPGDTTMRAQTWARARAIREELLRKNPRHYDDVDFEDDPDGETPDDRKETE